MEQQPQIIVQERRQMSGQVIERFNLFEHLKFSEEKQQFDTSTIPRILIVARSQSGKSWVIKDLMYQLKDYIPYGVVVAPTNNEQQFYNQFFPESFIYEDYDPELINKIFSFQELKSIQVDKAIKEKNKPFNRTMMLVMDDLAFDKKILEGPEFGKLLYNSRHSHIFFIYSTQSISQIPPKIRNNFSHVFILKNDQQSDKRTIKDSFCGNLEMEEFKQLYNSVTQDFGSLVIDLNQNVSDHERFNKYKVFKSRDLTDIKFQFGSEKFWQRHHKKYDKEKKAKKAISFFKEKKNTDKDGKKLEFFFK